MKVAPVFNIISNFCIIRMDMATVVTAAMAEAAPQPIYDLSKWKYAELRDTINTSIGRFIQCLRHVYEIW